MPQLLIPKKLKLSGLQRPITPSRTKTKKKVLFIIGDWITKLGSQEILRLTGKFGLGVQNETEQRLREFCQENMLVIANTLLQQHEMTLHTDTTRWSILKSDWLCSLQTKVEKLLVCACVCKVASVVSDSFQCYEPIAHQGPLSMGFSRQ